MTQISSKNNIRWDFETAKWEGINAEQVLLWERLYPNADVLRILKVDIPQWLDKKRDTKIARKKNWRTFICNWLKREQLKGVGL